MIAALIVSGCATSSDVKTTSPQSDRKIAGLNIFGHHKPKIVCDSATARGDDGIIVSEIEETLQSIKSSDKMKLAGACEHVGHLVAVVGVEDTRGKSGQYIGDEIAAAEVYCTSVTDDDTNLPGAADMKLGNWPASQPATAADAYAALNAALSDLQ